MPHPIREARLKVKSFKGYCHFTSPKVTRCAVWVTKLCYFFFFLIDVWYLWICFIKKRHKKRVLAICIFWCLHSFGKRHLELYGNGLGDLCRHHLSIEWQILFPWPPPTTKTPHQSASSSYSLAECSALCLWSLSQSGAVSLHWVFFFISPTDV